MSDTNIIACHGLEKTFSEAEMQVEVLRGIDLTIKQGECIALVGASGSGKSTLLHLLGGLDVPSKGEIRISDKEFSTLSETERGVLRNSLFGFVYQFHHLLPEFSALENVAMPLLIRGDNPAEAEETAKEILDKVGLDKRLQHKPGELSGGERQRAAIARALVTRPQCLLADEPTGNLDSHTAGQVFSTMFELNRNYGTSLIMATHNLDLANQMDSIFELHDGQLHQR